MARRRSAPADKLPAPTVPPGPAPARVIWGIVLALVVVTAATYAPVRGFDYVELDDPAYVTENPQVRAGLTFDGVVWAFTTGTSANWHPLTWLSHMADVSLFGVAPGPHHLVNLALHITTTVLLFLLLQSLTFKHWQSAFVAAVFALHPLHVESVAWVAERKDVLSALFWVLTLIAYVRYVENPSRLRFATVIVTFALGLMAKPMLVTLPCVMLLLDFWPLRRWSTALPRNLLPLIREKIPLFALTVASSVITVIVQSRGGAMAGLESQPLGLRLENAIVSTVAYLGKMIWPVDLNLLYGLPDRVPAGQLAGALLLLVAITVIAYRARARRPFLLVGWLWYLGTLVPVSGLVQVGLQSMADRYTYIPMIGISIMVAWGVPDALWSRAGTMVTRTAGALAVAAMVLLTRERLPVWQNNVTLFTAATMRTLGVDEYTAHMNLGATLMQQKRFGEARAHYQLAAGLQPQSADAARGVGLSYFFEGRVSESIRPLETAVALAPGNAEARAELERARAVFQGRRPPGF